MNALAHRSPIDAQGLMLAASVMDGVLHGEDVAYRSVEIDSRRIQPGGLFFAIRGDAQDGHQYIVAALKNGAVAAVVDHLPENINCPLIVVEDTTAALGTLAKFWRTQFTVPVVGVTGSNGKTTVSAMLREIFAVSLPGIAPMGSFNNHWGVPLTLLTLDEKSQSAVIEMGMNHPGELSYLTDIVRPDVAVIINSASAHLEGLQSIEGVAKAKAEILDGLDDNGVAVLNVDDEFFPLWQARVGKREVKTFGFDETAEVRAAEIRFGAPTRFVLHAEGEQREARLSLLGEHNVQNALAAAATALAAGASLDDVVAGLAAAQAPQGRLRAQTGVNGAVLIDDSYNANPASMKAGLEVLANTPGKRIAALGAMAELGDKSIDFHREIGEFAYEVGVDELLAVGEVATAYAEGFSTAVCVKDIDEAAACLRERLDDTTTVLIKGSRSAGMERLLAALQTSAEGAEQKC